MTRIIGAMQALAAILFGCVLQASPREFGRVHWQRDLDLAWKSAAATGKPVLVLFQEVPGCSTCVSFGERVLSHPLLVDAMETEFVPVAIYNNKGGKDAEILARFSEPAWNNPVVRFVDASGRDLIPREDGVYEAGGIASRMVRALEAAKRPVPGYLRLSAEELRVAKTERATFAVHCYWEGEARLGALPGVVSTRAASLDGREVVEVSFDPSRLPYADLVRQAAGLECAAGVYASTEEQLATARQIVGDRAERARAALRDAPASDRQYYLERSALRFAPLTRLQAQRVNSALRSGQDPREFLSARQQALAKQIDEALKAAPALLDGLSRPADAAKLVEYEVALRSRLEGAHRSGDSK